VVDPARPLVQSQRIVAQNRYLTLATADTEGRPWATPVWFAADGLTTFCWVSRPGARHSVNIAVQPNVALVVFDSTVLSSDAAAVYVEAKAAEVDADQRAEVLAVYNRRSVAQGLGEWTDDKVTAPGQFRLYRAVASKVYVLDDHDQRIVVRPTGPPAR
jgi:nitroimidazol reductase NimA-like FMN-containing flavoprotein (pyridoxamine 5'-phosphate oxidase superfamily)